MRALVWLLAALAVAVALAVALRGGAGYVLIVLHPWRVEISLALFAILLVFGFAALYFALRIASKALNLPSHVREFRQRRRERLGRHALLGAIQALFEGRFLRAEKLATQARERDHLPALAGLLAARAAQRLRQFERRDEWLDRVRQDEGEWRSARLMTEAELLIEERRFEPARALLQELHASGPRHIASLTLLLRVEQSLGNWDEVLRLARLLEKRDAMPAAVLDSIRVNAHVALLSRDLDDDLNRLKEQWRRVPQTDRRESKVALAAARAFMRLGDARSTREAIEAALEAQWDADLVLLYSECPEDECRARIEKAERWLTMRPEDAELLLVLGRLCARCGLWGKAESYLEASLALQASRDAHIALAELHERLERPADAAGHYRAAAGAGRR
jgi:HemY protein